MAEHIYQKIEDFIIFFNFLKTFYFFLVGLEGEGS